MASKKMDYLAVPIDEPEKTEEQQRPVTPRLLSKLKRPRSIKLMQNEKNLLSLPIKKDIYSPTIQQPPGTGLSNSSTNKYWHRTENKQTRLNTHLLRSVENGKLDLVLKYLSLGANPNTICRSNHLSAINLAALLGFKDIMIELLNRGACIDFEDKYGQNILHYLAFAENLECMQEIISYAKQTKTYIKNILTTIINKRADESEPLSVPKIFLDNLEHNCDQINNFIPIFERGSTPLHIASQQANVDICYLLIENGANIDIEDDRGCLPMNVVGEAFLNTGDDDLQTELTCFLDSLKLFINYDATFTDSDKCYMNNPTPLHTAIELEHLESVILLLNKGANPAALNSDGETAMHLAITKHNEEILKALTDKWIQTHDTINIKNNSGYTPFQVAVDLQWIPGIYILLEAGANVTETAHNGDSALHIAAASGNLDLVMELLDIPETNQVLELRNEVEETPLFCAVKSGNKEIVKALLNAGADIFTELSHHRTLLHRTVEYGYSDILKELVTTVLGKDKKQWLEKRDTLLSSGRTALHIGASRNEYDCVEILLESGCNVYTKTTESPFNSSTALHLACQNGQYRIVELLLQYKLDIIHDKDGSNWNALHLAATNGHRKCVKILLQNGADLSETAYIFGMNHRCVSLSAFEMVLYNISRPTEFMEEVFNSCVTKNEFSVNDPNCLIQVDHSMLMPSGKPKEVMKVLKTIMNTGNRFGQKRLLLHPVVESYLNIKWRALCLFFYLIFFMYIVYVVALTSIALTLFFLNEYENKQYFHEQVIHISCYVVLVVLVVIIIMDILHAIQNIKKYLTTLETWLKWVSFVLTAIVVAVEFCQLPREDWLRHVTAIAILLVWIELMFLFSRFPSWGYYVLMFFKVAKNVLKVILTFNFLIIGFAFAFLIEFRTVPPFSNPIEALLKTIVMMTSEYDYSDLFESMSQDVTLTPTLIIGRIVFMAFIILVSIVLMNLMVGLAVSDITVLEIKGQMQRLEKQVEFLSALSFLVRFKDDNNSLFRKELNNWVPIQNKSLLFYPGKFATNSFTDVIPLEILESLTDIAEKTEQEDEITINMLSEKLDEYITEIKGKLDQLEKKRDDYIQKRLKEKGDKPKKKLLNYLQSIMKRNEGNAIQNRSSAMQSTENLYEQMKHPAPVCVTNAQRLDNIEELLKNISNKNNL